MVPTPVMRMLSVSTLMGTTLALVSLATLVMERRVSVS